jgi:tetratricopeptide (TPR) repeat protein
MTSIVLRPRRLPSAAPIQRAKDLHGQGLFADAERIYAAVLADHPGEFEALHLLGLLRHQQGRELEALSLIGAALKSNPGSADALSNLGLVLDALRRYQDALVAFDAAIALDGGHVNAISNRALALSTLGRTDEALAGWAQALSLVPGHAQALHGRGNTLFRLKRFEEALADYDRFLAIRSGNPDVFNNRCSALSELGKVEEALDSYDRALALDPDLPEVLINKGHIFADLNRFEDALVQFGKAAGFESKRAEAIFCQSLVRLRRGEFSRGWREYEWRWKQTSWGEQVRDFKPPLWLGERPLTGRTILLHAEQGFGDTLHFVRYVPLVERLGAQVVLEVQAPLEPLLSTMDGASRVLARGEPLPDFDLHCPLMSLPLAFGTELASIPVDIPYLQAPAERIARWRDRLGQKRGPRVGFAWAGSPVHERNRTRSIPLEQFAPLLRIAGLELVSLQKEMSDAEAAALRDLPGVVPLGREFADFADAAAVISELDLVVSVDTAVVHLAGALGIPVWVLVPHLPDFRWLLSREDSPWYPSARLLRQPRYGDWTSVLERTRRELEAFAARV